MINGANCRLQEDQRRMLTELIGISQNRGHRGIYGEKAINAQKILITKHNAQKFKVQKTQAQ